MDDTQNGGTHDTRIHEVTNKMGHPNKPNHSPDKPANMARPSNYLKTFMYEFSSDDESPPPVKPKTSFFYQDEVPTNDFVPQHPAKRKRTSSNSSNSDFETRAPSRQYSRKSSNRSSRNNSEKSGTVCGTYGSKSDGRPCYRPKFPSDDSDDFKDISTKSESKSPVENGGAPTKEVCSNGTSTFKKEYSNSRTYGSSTAVYRPRFPSDRSPKKEEITEHVKLEALDSPSTVEDSDKDGSTDTHTDKETNKMSRESSPAPALRVRPGRTAAVKAQDLIKSFAPRQHRSKDSRLQVASDDDYCSDGSYDYGVQKYNLDSELLKTLPDTLQIGYRFYSQLRNDPVLKQDLVPFLDPVDASRPSTKDYYKKIEKPMCLTKIEEKMASLDYFSTPEIIGDIRLIFENCYRYNGTETWISKLACKVEMSLEQRITLLPYSMRGKCALAETSPHLTLYRDICGRRTRVPRMFTGCSRSPIMLAMEEMSLYRKKEVEVMEQQQSYRREAQLQEKIATLASFVTSCPNHSRVSSSWELISSCLMICVCQEEFNIPFTVGALELGLLYPQHSSYLAKLMINLCSTGKRTKELEKQNKVSYEEWNREVARRVHNWYSITNKRGTRHAQTSLGVTNEMYDLFGTYQSPLGTPSDNSISTVNQAVVGGKLFHELSMGQRLTLLHSLCTSKVTTSPRLQNCFLEYDAESLRPTHLGQDGLGNLYFHFPLWPEEVRVYVEICPSADSKETGEIVCVARSTDDLQTVTEQLETQGQISRLAEHRKKGGPGKRLLKSAAKTLVQKLKSLHEELVQHKSHHLLVETTVYKELAQAMSDCESLEIKTAPPTPPRPSTPISQPDDQTASSNDVKSEILSESESEEATEQRQNEAPEEESEGDDVQDESHPPTPSPSEVKAESPS